MGASCNVLAVIVLFALCSALRMSYAGPVGPLTSFSAGTVAKASEVNGNFSAVKNAVDDNAARVGTLESTVTPAGNIVLAPSTANTGSILKGTTPFIHNFGTNNTFVGANAGNFSMTGIQNVVYGGSAFINNTSGSNNTAIGFGTLQSNTSGDFNIAIGFAAGQFVGGGSQNIFIGNQGGSNDSGTIRIGGFGLQTATFIAGISGAAIGAGSPVSVNSVGQLGTTASSRSFKEAISDMGNATSRLMQLRPVTFRYKPQYDDGSRQLQYGLIAEEVATVYPGLVASTPDGKVQSVRYQFLAPMLLNEYQRQQRTIQAQSVELKKQTARIAELARDRQAQTAELKKQSEEIAELKQQASRMATLLGRLEQAGKVSTASR